MSIRLSSSILLASALSLIGCDAGNSQTMGAPSPGVPVRTSQPQIASGSLPAGAYRFQKAAIIDPSGFGRPMTAYSLFVPAGWSTSGGVVWQMNQQPCGPNGTHVAWRADAPDGISAIEVLPEETWGGNNLNVPEMQQACPNVTVTNIRDYLQWYAERVRPGARILDYRERSDVTEPIKHLNRTEPSPGGEMSTWFEAGEVLLAYQLNGHDVRETLATIVMFMLTRMAGVMAGEIREFLIIAALPSYAVRAPSGQLDFKLAETVRLSLQQDPQWAALMAEHNRKMTAINTRGARDRHEIQMKSLNEIAEINQRGYDNRQAVIDGGNQKFNQMIRGVDTYLDSSSNERIELPSTHDNVWRLDDGTFILTDDANFLPGRDFGVDGRQLEVAR